MNPAGVGMAGQVDATLALLVKMYGLKGHWSSWGWSPTAFSLARRCCPQVNPSNPLAKEIALYYYEGCFDNQAPLPVAG